MVVKIDSTAETDALRAVDEIREKGINRLDLVIANAGVARSYPKVSDLKAVELLAHLTPNVFGVVWLYQATLPLLRASDSPKWVTMGSAAGSMGVRLTNIGAGSGASAGGLERNCSKTMLMDPWLVGTTSGP